MTCFDTGGNTPPHEPRTHYVKDVERARDALLDLYATYEGTEPFQSWWPKASPALDACWEELHRLRNCTCVGTYDGPLQAAHYADCPQANARERSPGDVV